MDHPTTCRGCDAPLDQLPGRGRRRVWCSESCRSVARGKSRPKVERTCVRCGVNWMPQRMRKNEWCPSCRSWAGSPPRQCEYCGVEYRGAGGRFCSQRCNNRCRAGWSASVELVHVPPAPREPRVFEPSHTSSGRVFVAGSCRRCGESFTILDQLGSRYCSGRCARADGKDRRRALKRDSFVGNVYRKLIFERDGWRCQICRRQVNRDAVVPHPKAPTLDHIVPLAAGGTHEPSNCQLACFTCNSRKGDRAANDQLRLIG